jgi:hypothetical protein
MSTEYRDFLALPYEELEELNLQAKRERVNRVSIDEIREKRLKYLRDEERIKAVTVLFSDLEGRLHLLDYDKKFLLGAYENLTFDGSSIRGFTAQRRATCASASIGARSTGFPPMFSATARSSFSESSSTRMAPSIPATCAAS